MKTLLILLWISTCVVSRTQAADKTETSANATNYFIITGMHCDGCANGLTAELMETKGVIKAQVTFSNQLAMVAIDTNKINTTKLTTVIKEAGFTGIPTKP